MTEQPDSVHPTAPARRLEGRVAVIAGARGEIAEAVATRFVSEGATVVGIDREAGRFVEAELSDESTVVRAVAEIVDRYGRIDVLYNNAGSLDPEDHSLETNSVETWQAAYASIVLPVVLTCKHVVPVMRGQGSGSIVNTGSFLAGMGAATAQTAFSAAKSAVVQISRDLGIHLAKSGIRVNSLSLGPVESAVTRAMFGRLPRDALQERLSHVPYGRFATLAEIAGAAAFLASDDSGYITGADLPVYGGIQGAYTIPS